MTNLHVNYAHGDRTIDATLTPADDGTWTGTMTVTQTIDLPTLYGTGEHSADWGDGGYGRNQLHAMLTQVADDSTPSSINGVLTLDADAIRDELRDVPWHFNLTRAQADTLAALPDATLNRAIATYSSSGGRMEDDEDWRVFDETRADAIRDLANTYFPGRPDVDEPDDGEN